MQRYIYYCNIEEIIEILLKYRTQPSQMHRQAEFGALLCLTVPKTAVESPETGPTGRVSGKKLPVGREREGEREKQKERRSFEIGSFALIV